MYFWTPLPCIPDTVGGVPVFSRAHLLWLSFVLGFCLTAALLFCRTRQRSRMLRVLSLVMMSAEIARMLLLLCAGVFDAAWGLPLHLCGIMVFVEGYAVRRREAFLLELCWSLGLPGAFCALLTPGETLYPLWNIYYLQFILVHTLLFLIPLLLALDGFCPNPRLLPRCFMFLLCLAAMATQCNTIFGGNYLFLSQAPAGSVLEMVQRLAGPWYLCGAAALVGLIWSLEYGGGALIRMLFYKRCVPAEER